MCMRERERENISSFRLKRSHTMNETFWKHLSNTFVDVSNDTVPRRCGSTRPPHYIEFVLRERYNTAE